MVAYFSILTNKRLRGRYVSWGTISLFCDLGSIVETFSWQDAHMSW
jgi:hypothetical protein